MIRGDGGAACPGSAPPCPAAAGTSLALAWQSSPPAPPPWALRPPRGQSLLGPLPSPAPIPSRQPNITTPAAGNPSAVAWELDVDTSADAEVAQDFDAGLPVPLQIDFVRSGHLLAGQAWCAPHGCGARRSRAPLQLLALLHAGGGTAPAHTALQPYTAAIGTAPPPEEQGRTPLGASGGAVRGGESSEIFGTSPLLPQPALGLRCNQSIECTALQSSLVPLLAVQERHRDVRPDALQPLLL